MLFLVAVINFVCDPGKIYLKKIINNYSVLEYVDILEKSDNGLIQENWNERSVKVALAQKSNKYDCIVLGSSHALQISSVRNTGNINKQCSSLLNLSVSGGSLEDIFIFSNIILNKEKKPLQVFLGIDPWTLKFNMDARYLVYERYYYALLKRLDINISRKKSYERKILVNLINREYFFRSLKLLFHKNQDLFSLSKIEKVDEKFDINTGYKRFVYLSDGSIVYSEPWIKKQESNLKNMPKGGGDYKIEENIYDKDAVNNFLRLVDLYKNNGVKVNFLVTPYHPNVFKAGETKTVKHIKGINKGHL
jgi:hypothetical protein